MVDGDADVDGDGDGNGIHYTATCIEFENNVFLFSFSHFGKWILSMSCHVVEIVRVFRRNFKKKNVIFSFRNEMVDNNVAK